MEQNKNGHGKTTEVTLPDSGVTLRIKRVSPLLVNDIRKALKRKLPKPEAPLQEVDYGDGHKVTEANVTHPDYVAAMKEYNAESGVLLVNELIAYGVECEVDAAQVSSLRAQGAVSGLDFPADDLTLYVSRIAISSNKDLTALQDAILGRFQPTEAAVKEAAATFPSPV